MMMHRRHLVSIRWAGYEKVEVCSTVIDTSLLTCLDCLVIEEFDTNYINSYINLHFILPFGLNRYTIHHHGNFNRDGVEFDKEKFKEWYAEEIKKLIVSAWDGHTQFVDISDIDSFFKRFLHDSTRVDQST